MKDKNMFVHLFSLFDYVYDSEFIPTNRMVHIWSYHNVFPFYMATDTLGLFKLVGTSSYVVEKKVHLHYFIIKIINCSEFIIIQNTRLKIIANYT